MKVLSNTAKFEESCNCRKRSNCPLHRNFLTKNILYKAQIMSNQANYKEKVYIGTVKTDFKHKFKDLTKSFNLKCYENSPKLSKEYWTMKRNHFTLKGTWIIIQKWAPLNTTKIKCFLRPNEKLETASHKKDSLLNKDQNLLTSVDTKTS